MPASTFVGDRAGQMVDGSEPTPQGAGSRGMAGLADRRSQPMLALYFTLKYTVFTLLLPTPSLAVIRRT